MWTCAGLKRSSIRSDTLGFDRQLNLDFKFFAADDDDASVAAFAVFHGTQTGEGGPVPPTGNSVAADYVYHMLFDGDRIKHMTKIWNDTISLQQLGWA